MILVTGGTGFIGQALIRHLVEAGYPVRTLIRPSRYSPNLPRGIPVEVAVSGLSDERNLRAAMVGVDTIYHLASAEFQGTRASLLNTDIQGAQSVARAAADAGVKRLFYVSHLGADRASAYPVLKAKAIAEEHIRRSGIDYTIFRSAVVFGVNDHFTTSMAQLFASLPLFALPSEGQTLLQPLWVEDLVASLTWALDDESTRNQTYEVGGPEYLSFRQIVAEIMNSMRIHRVTFSMRPPYLRGTTVFLDHLFPGLPISVYWLDYLASNHTCRLDTLPHAFHLMPARFSQRLEHLKGRSWHISLIKSLFISPERRRKEQKPEPRRKPPRPAAIRRHRET